MSMKGDSLFIAWRSGTAQQGAWGPVGRLDHYGGLFRFCYTRGARSLPGFKPFPKMEDLEAVYSSTELFPLFANRLLSPSRPDYEEYLRWGGFDPDNPPDPIAILGVTEGIRQTDAFEVFPCPAPDGEGCYLNKFFLHGIRWIEPPALQRVQDLQANEPLVLHADPKNPVDPNAVAVFTQKDPVRIGYVPRYLARDAHCMLAECDPSAIELFVQRVNPDAPLQHRVLCRMRACWPGGFRPCSDTTFEPLVSTSSQRVPT